MIITLSDVAAFFELESSYELGGNCDRHGTAITKKLICVFDDHWSVSNLATGV